MWLLPHGRLAIICVFFRAANRNCVNTSAVATGLLNRISENVAP